MNPVSIRKLCLCTLYTRNVEHPDGCQRSGSSLHHDFGWLRARSQQLAVPGATSQNCADKIWQVYSQRRTISLPSPNTGTKPELLGTREPKLRQFEGCWSCMHLQMQICFTPTGLSNKRFCYLISAFQKINWSCFHLLSDPFWFKHFWLIRRRTKICSWRLLKTWPTRLWHLWWTTAVECARLALPVMMHQDRFSPPSWDDQRCPR